MKLLNSEVVTSLLEHNFIDYFFQVLVVKIPILNIVVNINSINSLNISVNTTLKYYGSQDLNEKLKLMGMKFFSKKLLG